MTNIDNLTKKIQNAEKTNAYKFESFKIVSQEELLEILTYPEIRRILGTKKASKFMTGKMTPMRFIATFMDICEKANLEFKFSIRL